MAVSLFLRKTKYFNVGGRICAPKVNTYFTYGHELMHRTDRKPPIVCPDEAVTAVEAGNLVFCSGAAATPNTLIKAMVDNAECNKLKDVRICHMHTEGPAPYSKKEYASIFRSISFFMGKNVRQAITEGRADNLSLFLQDIPRLFHTKLYSPDVSFITVSPPDKHGYCTLGTSVDCVRAACMNSKKIVAQINQKMPRTFGDSPIHMSHFDCAIEIDEELPLHKDVPLTPEEKKIGKLIAENLVEDGATLQMGIGSIPDAVLDMLHNHKDLGIHSEMFANGVVDLVNKGAVTNAKKKYQQGKTVTSFLVGNQALYDFVDDNPSVEVLVVDYVNSYPAITSMPKMTAINSCIEIDLTGQISSDSIGTKFYSGFGGQVDFINAAAKCKDGKGKSIITMASQTPKGVSKIVPILKPGAGVVTTRAHVRYVVTEYGIASLWGRTMRQRAHALIQIAHPKHREALEKAAFERLKVMPSPT